MKKPHLRLHCEHLPKDVHNEKYLWWWFELPTGHKTCRCRTPQELCLRSIVLKDYLRSGKVPSYSQGVPRPATKGDPKERSRKRAIQAEIQRQFGR